MAQQDDSITSTNTAMAAPSVELKLSAEQAAAVQSTQGTLVQAAAGAGKTRVLIEHILYLMEEFAQQHFKQDGEKFKEELKKHLRSIFVMTYTNAAAEEMALRLAQRMRDKANETPFWPYAAECIGALRISTIHSFLMNILKRSYFLNFPWAKEILTGQQVQNFVQQKFKTWLWHVKDKLNPAIAAMLVRHDEQIISAFTKIFSDAQHRGQWAAAGGMLHTWQTVSKSPSSSSSSSSSSSIPDDFWPSVLSVLDLECLGEKCDLSFMAQELKDEKPWAMAVQSHFQKWPQINTPQGFADYVATIASFKGARRPKDKNPMGDRYFTAMISLREFIKKYEADLQSITSDPSTFQEWAKAYQAAFQELEQNYPWALGISYADMEYACWRGLQDATTQKMVQQEISYLIIDELQDTSWFQWEIIRLLINNDYRKLFLVGDPQQAIYGFRGGTAAVFQAAAQAVPQKLNLTANYRSNAKVIDFNNAFFSYLLAKRFSFEEAGNPTGQFFAQTVGQKSYGLSGAGARPTGPSFPCGAYLLQTIYSGEVKLSTAEINQAEALVLAQFIKKMVPEISPQEDICILYRKLDPAQYLLPLLADQKLVAQIKMEKAEDPILGMLHVLARYMFERQNAQLQDLARRTKMLQAAQDFVQVMMQAYFAELELHKQWTSQDLNSFVRDSELLGVRAAGLKFFQELALANSNYRNNWQPIWPLLANLPEDWEQITLMLERVLEEKVSLQLNFGGRQIKIMTVHAAKGLEFDHVLLGGIQTNGRMAAADIFLGTWPSSYQWKSERLDRARHNSPALILEKTATARQDFAESLRLFYVAATRAKKSLALPLLLKQDKGLKPLAVKNSWALGIKAWQNDAPDLAATHLTVENFSWPNVETNANFKIPWIQRDKLGLWAYNAFAPWAIISDLSVTRLTSLAVCPRQFYYQNICRIREDDLDLGVKYLADDFKLALGKPLLDFKNQEIFSPDIMDAEEPWADELLSLSKSSRERGTEIHQAISAWLKSLAVHTWEEQFPQGQAWQWAADFLAKYKDDYQFISEEELRFPLEGVVVNGIPDLVLMPAPNPSLPSNPANFAASVKPVMIWDFKTGHGENDQAYRAQVLAYAYGLYQLGRVAKTEAIQVGLIYLDQQKVKNEEVSWPKVEQFWQALWPKLSSLDCQKTSCPDCRFRIFCPA